MPRTRKYKATVQDRLNAGARGQRVRNAYGFVDPYPEIFGTIPEKIFYARLMYEQIPFLFQSKITVNIPELDLLKDYRPDFIFPELKIIVEVQGAHWHSKPEALDADAYKQALYNIMGYKVLAWWDYDILYDMDALFASEPVFNNYIGRRGGRIIEAGKQVIRDDAKGIRTLNSKRARPKGAALGRRSVRKPLL